jgi:chromosome segregation ATPase
MYKISGVILLALIFLLNACSDQKRIEQLEEKHAQLETEYKLLVDKAETNNRFIEEYTETINEVFTNLEKIREREGYIAKASRDLESQGNAPLRTQMLSDINSMDEDLKKSKSKLEELRRKLGESEVKYTKLVAIVDSLRVSVEQKETEVQGLRAEITSLNTQISAVEAELLQKEQEIVDQRRVLETAYYIIGTGKELKEKGIIEERGGFLGINKTQRVAASFSKDYFIPMDIKQSTISIAQNIKKIKIISPHNPASYTLNPASESETVLEIKDMNEFWKIKYLVIQANG